ncbi:hypothetical protein [Candidatus Paracaedibacter symbiosus]|uniref:hypothetical protein n=1 Tax=Candidatus Paracaedibacter symbiosus TaxID=244582 RepID=UPI0005098875|nr:hypothetical protein [Candidatus Paracaedibacter symbiosus]
MRQWFNKLTHAAVMCLETDHWVMMLTDGARLEGKSLEMIPELVQKPLLLVINPIQFLQTHQCLQHIYLTTWQQQMVRGILDSPCIVRAVFFLPQLVGSGSSSLERISCVTFADTKYLHLRQDGLTFWNQSKGQNHQQQLKDVALYLRRYGFEIDSGENKQELTQLVLEESDLREEVYHRHGVLLETPDFPLIERLAAKQRQSRRYIATVGSLLAGIATSVTVSLYFLWMAGTIVIDYNPWTSLNPSQSLMVEEREKLLQFKDFLTFQSRNKAFSAAAIQNLFHQFPGKIVATDMVWQQGEWTVAFVVSPYFLAEIPTIREWIENHLQDSKLRESESTPHQYILQFGEKHSG